MKAASNKRKVYCETTSNNNCNADKRRNNVKLSLSKSFNSALVIEVQLSDTEVQYILDTAMENYNKYSIDKSHNE